MESDEMDSLHGWLIVGVSFCSMIFTWGTAFSFGTFLGPLTTEFGYSAVQLSTVYSVELLAFYGLAGVMGVLVSVLPIRPIMIGLSVVLSLIAIWFLEVSSYLGLVVLFSAMGTVLGTMYVLLVAIVPQWFESREGLALGIIFAGNGLGMQILPPFWEIAISTLGLRTAFLWLTLLTAGVFFVTGLVTRRPRHINSDDGVVGNLLTWLLGLTRERKFWIAFIGAGFLFAWYYMLATHAVNMFINRGFSRNRAALLFGLIGGVSVLARLTSGYVADRTGPRQVITISTVAAGLGFFLLLTGSRLLLYFAIVCFGIGLGASATLYIPALMQSFNPTRDTAFVGVFNLVFAIFAFLMPLTSSLAIDVLGGYTVPFATMGLLTIGGAGLFWIGTR